MTKSLSARKSLFGAGSALAALAAASNPAAAQTWTGLTDESFLTSSNWSTSTVPGTGANVVVPGGTTNDPILAGGTVTLNQLYVGGNSPASLTVSSGASLTATTFLVSNPVVSGGTATQSGAATITGNGTVWQSDFAYVGFNGSGTLDLADRAQGTTGSLHLGTQAGSSGVLSVRGAGTTLQTGSAGFFVGDSGHGELTIDSGAVVNSYAANIGQQAGGSGTALVTGNATVWNITSGFFQVGYQGTGELEITQGAHVAATNALIVGRSNTGSLSIASGGVASTASYGVVGYDAGKVGTLTISGAGSTFSATSFIIVGQSGTGVVTLTNGGTISSSNASGVHLANLAGSSGTLNIGAAAGDVAAAPGIVAAPKVGFGSGSGKVVFNHTATDYTFATPFKGNGTVDHLAGTTRLTGTSTDFLGVVNVKGGSLIVDGLVAGTFDVLSGARLSGSGTIGGTTVRSGGTIAADGTLDVAGGITFELGSTYEVTINTATGESSRIVATGAAALAGDVVHLGDNGVYGGVSSHTILTAAGGVSGAFSGVTSNLAFLTPTLDYDTPNAVQLVLTRNNRDFSEVSRTDNQLALAQVLEGLPQSNPLVQALLNLTDEQARHALDLLSGDVLPTIQSGNVNFARQAQALALYRLRQVFSTVGAGAGATSSFVPTGQSLLSDAPVATWLQGVGDWSRTSGAGGNPVVSMGMGGALFGADMDVEGWRLGAMAGFTRAGFDSSDRSASGNSDNLHMGVYAGAEIEAWKVQLGALHSLHSVSSDRNVDFGGYSDRLQGRYGAQTTQVFGEVGYDLGSGAYRVEPFLGLSYLHARSDAFTETGASAALTTSASATNLATATAGLRAGTSFVLGDGILVTANGMIGFQATNGGAAASTVSLAGSTPFTVSGASSAESAAIAEAGLNFDLSENVNFDALYSGRYNGSQQSHGVKGTLAVSF